MAKEPDKPARKRHYTAKKLIDPVIDKLHPGATWKPQTRKGRLEVVVEVPEKNIDTHAAPR